MNFDDYQEKAWRTANKALDNNNQLVNAALGVSGEAGEFTDMIKKWQYQGHAMNEDAIIKELGDVLWYVALAASALGVSMDEIAVVNIEKLRKRYPEKFEAVLSLERTDM